MEIEFDLQNDFREIHEYDFGNGPIPAHQHPRGGGWVADTATVDDTCFVGPYARVFDNAYVTGNAIINDGASVFCNASVGNFAKVYGDAMIYDNASVRDNARVSGFTKVSGNARVMDNAQVYESAEIYGNAIICNNAEVYDNSKVFGNGIVYECIKLYGHTQVTKKPLLGLGFDYPVTVTDHHVLLGCTIVPPTILRKLGRRIITLVGYDKEQADLWLEIVDKLIQVHGCTDIESELTIETERNVILNLITERNAGSDRDARTR
jgi:carbonic anhydrase/acetyltransferase-like protein (isoleucine patch superfamily)